METMTTIANRQSCRAYTGEQISENELQTILEAANAAPVGMKKYENVKLTVVQNKELLDELDAAGAKFFGRPDAHPTYGAPTVILVSSIEPENAQNPSSYCNAACIIENMTLAATDLGLGSVYLLGVITALGKDPELCKKFKVPKGFIPASALAIGKSAAPLEKRHLADSKIEVEIIR